MAVDKDGNEIVIDDNIITEPDDLIPEHEVEAREKGWRPEAEFDSKDGKPWVDAATFLDRGQFMDTISKQKKKLDRLTKDMENLKEHNSKIEAAAIMKAKEELKAEKARAYSESDGEAIVAIEDQEKTLEEREQAIEANKGPDKFEEWIEDNAWYNDATAPEMRTHADMIARGMQAQGIDPDTIFEKVEEEVKLRFPDKFGKKPTLPKHGHESGNQGGHAAPASDWNQLSDVQKKVATEFERDGVMSKKEYIKQLKEADMIGV